MYWVIICLFILAILFATLIYLKNEKIKKELEE